MQLARRQEEEAHKKLQLRAEFDKIDKRLQLRLQQLGEELKNYKKELSRQGGGETSVQGERNLVLVIKHGLRV